MTVGFDVLTGGFDGFDVIDSRFWWFWQVVLMVLMVLMILTGGFDGFDVLTAGFDSRFWWFWQVVFGFEGCIINDSRFWWFWCFDRWFLFWRLYFKSCYHDRRFCLLKTLLSGNSPSHPPLPIAWLCCEKTVKTVHSCEQKVDCL